MAKRKKRRSTRKQKEADYPGWLWMLFGLAIGLSVAFAVYVKDREPNTEVALATREPASMQSSLDNNAETKVVEEEVAEPKEKRFDFYDMLPAFEIVVETEKPAVDADVEPQAIEEAGVYLLQAGSFSTHNDADRRRAELALHGIESRVQRARVNNRDFYRVYIGPIDDLDELNITRSRLRAAKIDVMRIRLGD
jgi:cell division protein FtsN